jgi:hypothetical protein
MAVAALTPLLYRPAPASDPIPPTKKPAQTRAGPT